METCSIRDEILTSAPQIYIAQRRSKYNETVGSLSAIYFCVALCIVSRREPCPGVVGWVKEETRNRSVMARDCEGRSMVVQIANMMKIY